MLKCYLKTKPPLCYNVMFLKFTIYKWIEFIVCLIILWSMLRVTLFFFFLPSWKWCPQSYVTQYSQFQFFFLFLVNALCHCTASQRSLFWYYDRYLVWGRTSFIVIGEMDGCWSSISKNDVLILSSYCVGGVSSHVYLSTVILAFCALSEMALDATRW